MPHLKIRLIRPCNAKLSLIKIFKEISGIGLQDAKNFVDELITIPFKDVEFEIGNHTISDIDNILMEFSNSRGFESSDDEFSKPYVLNGGTAYERDKKILKLGIGVKEDYVEFLSDSIKNNVVNSEDILKFTLNKLTKKDLIEIINLIN